MTSLYLRGNGANNSTTILDESLARQTCTPVGSVKISTTQSKFGGSSIYFNGTSDGITLENYPANTGSANLPLTIHGFVYPDSLATANKVIAMQSHSITAPLGGDFYAYIFVTTGKLRLSQWTGSSTNHPYADSTLSVSTGAWYHIIFQWNTNGTVTFGVNGTLENVTTTSSTGGWSPGKRIGSAAAATYYYYQGYMDDLRIDNLEMYSRTGTYRIPTYQVI